MAERRFRLASREDKAGSKDPRAASLRADITRLRIRAGLIDAELAAREARTPSAAGRSQSKAWTSGLPAPPDQRIFVEYWLGDPHAFAWVLAAGHLSWISLGSSADIERASRRLHEEMRSLATVSTDERRVASEDLNRLIISPLAAVLGEPRPGSHPELVILADQALRYVPFAALRDPADETSGRPYLVQRFDIAVGTALRHFSGTALAPNGLAPQTAAQPTSGVGQRMLLVADPVYSRADPRLARLNVANQHANDAASSAIPPLASTSPIDPEKLERLPSTAHEAEKVSNSYGRDKVDLLMGLDATRESVLNRDLARYRFIHIASHGMVDAEVPQLSSLILGRYGRTGSIEDPTIRASDLLERTFNAQAVVLSACDSSLGKEFAAEGIVGLRYAALARGARSVVASLWPVTDEITAVLMTSMYRGIAERAPDAAGGGTKIGSSDQVVHALSAAMRGVLAEHPGLDLALWAPFAVYVAGQ
jgi:CHAT domain-containing protein